MTSFSFALILLAVSDEYFERTVVSKEKIDEELLDSVLLFYL